jgi:hypothetical protein
MQRLSIFCILNTNTFLLMCVSVKLNVQYNLGNYKKKSLYEKFVIVTVISALFRSIC